MKRGRARDVGRGKQAEMRAGVREIRNVSCAHKMMIQKRNGGEQSSNGLSFQTAPSFPPCIASYGVPKPLQEQRMIPAYKTEEWRSEQLYITVGRCRADMTV